MRHSTSRFAYRLLLRMVHKELRSSHGLEMERLFSESLDLELQRHGKLGYVVAWWAAVTDVITWATSNRVGSNPTLREGVAKATSSLLREAAFLQDIGYTFRSLRRSPGFASIVAATLALGLGGCFAMFSVVDVVLLRPLPFSEPARLYTLWETREERGRYGSLVSPPTFMDWRDQAESFTEIAALSSGSATLTGGALPERVSTVMASPNIFSLLGISMAHGNSFPAHALNDDGGRFVVLSHGFWRRWYGEDPAAVGGTLLLDDEPHIVVGVLPSDFRFPEAADLWLPLTFGPEQLIESMRGARYLRAIGRLETDVTLERACAEMAAIAEGLGKRHAVSAGWGVELSGLRDHMVEEFELSLVLLLLATAFVLTIACVNVANLALARSSERRRERAVRVALGAGRLRLIRQSLLLHVTLSLLGGAAGLVVAMWAIPQLVRLAPAGIPRIGDVTMDYRLLVVCLVLSVIVGVLLTAISHWTDVESDPSLTLRSARLGGTRVRHQLRHVLIVTEVGLSVLLLIGAGLLLRSFVKLQRVDPGFSTSGVVTASLSLPESRYESGVTRATLFHDLMERLTARPDIVSAGATTNLPLSGSRMSFGFSIEERPDVSFSEQLVAEYHAVTPGYFKTMGIRILDGRVFEWSDDASGVPVAVINETMARRYWPDQDPIGERMTVVSQDGPQSREISGVVADVRHGGLSASPRIEVYVPMTQDPWAFATVVLDAVEPSRAGPAVRTELTGLDPLLSIGQVSSVELLVAKWLAPLRFQLVLLGLFASIALVLAALGLYGVISYVVGLRTGEIGVRMALGARKHRVFGAVVGQGLATALVGAAVGMLLALMGARYLSSILFEVTPTDPLVFLTAPSVVLLVAALACYVPARRAVKVDPVIALREM